MSSRRPRLSAKDIDRIIRAPLPVVPKAKKKPMAQQEMTITCPHCNEPFPILIVIDGIGMRIGLPRKKRKVRG